MVKSKDYSSTVVVPLFYNADRDGRTTIEHSIKKSYRLRDTTECVYKGL